jgi:hypothetical protein
MIAHVWTALALAALTTLGPGAAAPQIRPELLIAPADALTDVTQLGFALATDPTPNVERYVDGPALRAQVETLFRKAGIESLRDDLGAQPRLVVHVEGVPIPDADRYVYRVQASLHRLVALTGRPNRRIPTEAWQVRPVMRVVPQAEAQEAIAEAVLMQTEVFLGAWAAARKLSRPNAGMEGAGPGAARPAGTEPADLRGTGPYPFVASRSSAVFHRADCRWAQNIAERNLVGYRTRDEAVRAGKRPCRTCEP